MNILSSAPTKLLGGGAATILTLVLVQAAGGFLTDASADAASCVQTVSTYTQAGDTCTAQKASTTTVTPTAWGQYDGANLNPAADAGASNGGAAGGGSTRR